LKKVLLLVLAVILLIFLGLFIRFYAFRYFPHERIEISLPWAPEDDDLIFINPMGEKVEHANSPLGHPGIDFGWHHPAPLIASVGGRVTKIDEHSTGGHGETEKVYNVEVVTGVYAVRYQEIAVREGLKEGMHINKGDIIGRGGKYVQEGGLGTYYNMHWEFDFNSPIFDRLCPMTYFDQDSQARITAIFDKVGQTYNGQYPAVCSGAYDGREEKI
jgi:hypothetical protein